MVVADQDEVFDVFALFGEKFVDGGWKEDSFHKVIGAEEDFPIGEDEDANLEWLRKCGLVEVEYRIVEGNGNKKLNCARVKDDRSL